MIILTEKPSVAAAFAAALGVARAGAWFENADYCIVNAFGHLLENYAPEDYDPALKKWSLESLPIIPREAKLKPIAKTENQLELIKTCFAKRRGEPLLLATDAEREGELIGAEILDYAGFTAYDSARRFWVSEALTTEVILAGIDAAKPLAEYTPYKEQGRARQQADWLAGLNITRLISVQSGKLLTFGRVQTAVLGAVYQRENEIANFKKEKYIEVLAVLDAGSPVSVKLLNPDNEEFPLRFRENAPSLAEISAKKEMLKTGIITAMKKDQKTVPPPQLFNLTALQKEAHKKFAYTPEQTLNIAQALYEKHKCLSYPRTPSRVMGDENVNLVKTIYEKLSGAYAGTNREADMAGAEASRISGDYKRLFNSADLQDHHALIPLAALPENAAEEEDRIYSLVFRQFFNLLKSPYMYNAVTVDVDIAGFPFRGNGVELIQTGWKTEPDEDEEPEDDYSRLAEGGQYPVSSVTLEEKFTAPKKHYTFASILQLMENPRGEDGKHLSGLGTPATRGAILQKLVDRGYITLQGKNIRVSDEGAFLMGSILKSNALAAFISIPETTRWEEQLHSDTAAFLEGIKDFVRHAVANTSIERFQEEKMSLGKCPLCGGNVYEGKKNYYCSNYKSESKCVFTIWKEISGAAVTLQDLKTLLAGKHTKSKKCKSKAGKEFHAAFSLQEGEVKFIFEK